ncbi:hypothetical protein CYMTET_53145, partial [Cymbomonas tetramitiformis]
PAKQSSIHKVMTCMDHLMRAHGASDSVPEGLPTIVTGDFNSQKRHTLAWKILHGDARGVSGRENWCGVESAECMDVFDAWREDSPSPVDSRGEEIREFHGLRTGSCNGTTWHAWGGTASSVKTAEAMHEQCKHLTLDPIGPKGHERHIDHINFTRSCRPQLRVKSAAVVTHRSCSVSFGGGCECSPMPCECHGFGIWASDHFPVQCDVRLHYGGGGDLNDDAPLEYSNSQVLNSP